MLVRLLAADRLARAELLARLAPEEWVHRLTAAFWAVAAPAVLPLLVVRAVLKAVRPLRRVQSSRLEHQLPRLLVLLTAELVTHPVVVSLRRFAVTEQRLRLLLLLLRLDRLTRLPLVVEVQLDRVARHWRLVVARLGPLILRGRGVRVQALRPPIRPLVHLRPEVVAPAHVYP